MSSKIARLKEIERLLDSPLDNSWIPVSTYMHSLYPNGLSRKESTAFYATWSVRYRDKYYPYVKWIRKVDSKQFSKIKLYVNKTAVELYREYVELLYEVCQEYYYKGREIHKSDWSLVNTLLSKYPDMKVIKAGAWMCRINRWFLGIPKNYKRPDREKRFLTACIAEFGEL